MWCIVNLPNGTQQAVKCDPKAIGQECLEKVCKALDIICEMEYFGLEHWVPNQKESSTRQWINLRNRLNHDGGSGNSIQLMLALRVKFWVPIHFILQKSVRNIFFMQAKVDLLEGRLNAKDWENAAKLGALLCQADGIRFNEAALKEKCPIRIKQEQEQLQQNVCHQHKDKKEKEHVLSFKKRRLSKQKSIEFDLTNNHHFHHHQQQNNDTATPPITNISSLSQFTSTNMLSTIAASNLNLDSDECSSSTSSTTNTSTSSILPTSALKIYENYIVQSHDLKTPMPDEFLRQIAVEHGKLDKLKMSPKSAKYWLLKAIQDLPGYGEEKFSGFTANESSVRCDIAVGAHGITCITGDDKNSIPFSAIAAAKSFRRTFKLDYVDDHNNRKELEIKLPKHCIAAGLYRSITERHAFYECEKVRGVVTNQFTRDFKGTIASMFKEDTELGKRYVFDIQMTCREVHDQARRKLHDSGFEFNTPTSNDNCGKLIANDGEDFCDGEIDRAIKEKAEREAAIERCVDMRISEAMTCNICMDRKINTMFNPCSHVLACSECSSRCDRCPHCRAKITSIVPIYLPAELRPNTSNVSAETISSETDDDNETKVENTDNMASTSLALVSHSASIDTSIAV